MSENKIACAACVVKIINHKTKRVISLHVCSAKIEENFK